MVKLRYYSILAGGLLALMLPALADQPAALTPQFNLSLSDAFSRADAQNPQLLAVARSLDINQGDITIAGAVPNPQIGVQYGFGTIATEQGNPQQVGITQTIELGGKRDARLQVAAAQYQLTSLQLTALRWTIHTQVRRAYAELAAAEAAVEAVNAQVKLADQVVDIARKRVEVGVAPAAELLQAKLARTQLDTQTTQAQGRVQNARTQLNSLLGEDPQPTAQVRDRGLFNLRIEKTELVPTPDAPMPGVENLLQQAYNLRPDLRALLQQAQVAQNQVRLADAQRTPDLQVGVAYAFTTYTNGNAQGSGFIPSVGLTVPLFYNQGGEIAKARAIFDQVGLQNKALRQQIATDVRTAYQSMTAARENIRKYQTRLLPDSTEVLSLAQESYQVGKTGLTSVIVAQQADQQIRLGYLEAVVAYQNAWADLEGAVGAPLPISS